MTTQLHKTETLSSLTGRSWLKNTQDVASEVASSYTERTGIPPQPLKPTVKTVEVSLPDVTSATSSETGFDLSQTIAPAIVAKLLSGDTIPESTNDISETPAQWGEKTAGDQTARTNPIKVPKPNKGLSLEDAVDSLCNSILERFPLGDPSVILFVGAEPNHHIDEASARIAARMADRNIGRVLLLDSDLQDQALTHASGLEKSDGISDVTNAGKEWSSLIYSGESKGLDFMPGGSHERFRHPEEKTRLRAAITQMKQKYQFVMVSAGDAHGLSAKIWNDICDGSYLLVSMKNSNETYAQSAVAELQASGARLLGCVLTDTE